MKTWSGMKAKPAAGRSGGYATGTKIGSRCDSQRPAY
jgi:hypothetical protein